MADIFISYRREDNSHAAGRLYSELATHMSTDQIFMDVDSIPPGVDFVEFLEDKVTACKTLFAVIGPGWLHAKDNNGQRRLDNDEDFVRIEIATALERKIPVVPILIDGTSMPRANELPDNLKSLARRNAFQISHYQFASDVQRLFKALKFVEVSQSQAPKQNRQPDGSIAVKIGSGSNTETRQMVPGKGKQEWFQDASFAPEMVVVPPGRFMMGSPENEQGRNSDGRESPQHEVIISDPFAVGRFAVTFAEWDYFVAQSRRSHKADDEGWGRDHRPVINVNWNNAKAYANWLSEQTGYKYRLLTEAEWEYVARAGTRTPFWWGEDISTEQANYDGNYIYGNGAKGQYLEKTVPVDSYEPNAWGLYNVHGNVWEWCEDAWHDSYKNAPSDGQAWLEEHGGDVGRRVLRGGSWFGDPQDLRSATRDWYDTFNRVDGLGFRLSRTLFSSGT